MVRLLVGFLYPMIRLGDYNSTMVRVYHPISGGCCRPEPYMVGEYCIWDTYWSEADMIFTYIYVLISVMCLSRIFPPHMAGSCVFT